MAGIGATPEHRDAYARLHAVCEVYAEDMETLGALLGKQYQIDIVEVPTTFPAWHIVKSRVDYATVPRWW